jgi:hypothetical protein
MPRLDVLNTPVLIKAPIDVPFAIERVRSALLRGRPAFAVEGQAVIGRRVEPIRLLIDPAEMMQLAAAAPQLVERMGLNPDGSENRGPQAEGGG